MDGNTLRWLLQRMDEDAQRALSRDGSFLEALQALKWEVDRDPRVQAAKLAMRNRGLSMRDSFVPRIRIRLCAGEITLDPPKEGSGFNGADAQDRERVNQTTWEPLTQELRNAASAVVSGSRYCCQLDDIVNEALRASNTFEQLAAVVESSGYELQICLDLSTYGEVREPGSTIAQFARSGLSEAKAPGSKRFCSESSSLLTLSSPDLQFLKQLRISLD